MSRLGHWIAHQFDWQLGRIVWFRFHEPGVPDSGMLFVGHRCGTCGDISDVHIWQPPRPPKP